MEPFGKEKQSLLQILNHYLRTFVSANDAEHHDNDDDSKSMQVEYREEIRE